MEVKYGCIHGGYPNYFVVSEVALLIYEPKNRKIFIEQFSTNADLDLVYVHAKTNELGHTIGRDKFVYNLRTRRRKEFDEDFKLTEDQIKQLFQNSYGARKAINGFFYKVLKKYRFRDIITFDGKRDVFLVEKQGVNLRGKKIYDIQKTLTKKCNYLFSMNKLAVATGFETTEDAIKSNNLSFYLHPMAGKHVYPGSAAWDAARMFIVHQEFVQHQDNFLTKAALLLQKIQDSEEAEKAEKAK
ncbi:MAG: hypothetical protein KJP00_05085 [Bacteroidia bacterium]|nr:hypothetical protein [Bacteroidia bacterium]